MANCYDQGIFDRFKKVAEENHLLPTKVTDFYKKKVDEEVAAVGIGGPLYRCVYPTEEKLTMFGPGEVEDFVQEYNHYPVEGNTDLVRQYGNRMLFMSTEVCLCNCSYCFRTIKLAESDEIVAEDSLEILIDYLKEHPELKELIISGGDAMLLSVERLENMFSKIKATGIKHIRLHTRAIVYDPSVITAEKIALISKYDVRIVFHIMHPYEICDVVRAKVKEMHQADIRMYNQNPILAGINDDAEVLETMFEELDDMRVRQMSIFTPDIIAYSASFRIPYGKICEIFDHVNHHTSAWVNSIRLVSAVPIGKVRREDIVNWDKEKGIITFAVDGETFDYVDFPEEMYKKSDKLLWKKNL